MATLTTYRQTLAPLLGSFHTGTATSGSSTSILECTSSLFKSSISQDSLYQYKWLLRPAASDSTDKVRVISSYVASSGYLYPDKAYTNSPNGEAFEVHGSPIEPLTEMLTILNAGLKRCFVPVEFSFSPSSSSATRHSMASAASWLTDPRWIYQVGYLGSGVTRNNANPYTVPIRGEANKDGSVLYLDFYPRTFSTSTTIYVRAIKPAYYHCAPTGGSYGAQSGLALESDIAPVDEAWLALAAKLEALDRYDNIIAGADQKQLDRVRQETAVRFSSVTQFNLPAWPKTFKQMARFRAFGAGRLRDLVTS